MKIVVLAGGLSPERDVSLVSGALIARALLENGHQVLPLDVYLGVPGLNCPQARFLSSVDQLPPQAPVPAAEPDLEALKKASGNGDSLIGPHVLELCKQADAVFLSLHGATGENGQVQAALELYGIPYTGSGYIGSLLAMDKVLSKTLMRVEGIPTPDWVLLDSNLAEKELPDLVYPCVIKPCSCGSSVGVSIVGSPAELSAALEYAKKYESRILAEELISGREFSIGILGGKALPVIEIIPKQGFYDYANKYQAGQTEEVCPAALPPELALKMQQTALQLHQALHLGFYSRVDIMMKPDGAYYCLEANTLPGMTPTSLLPQEAAAAGISYNQLCQQIAMDAITPISRK